MALMVFKTCCKVEGGLPNSIKLQMMFNIVFDFLVGLVPFIGDVADAAFKANTRNALLLEAISVRRARKSCARAASLSLPSTPAAPKNSTECGTTAHRQRISQTPRRNMVLPCRASTRRCPALRRTLVCMVAVAGLAAAKRDRRTSRWQKRQRRTQLAAGHGTEGE